MSEWRDGGLEQVGCLQILPDNCVQHNFHHYLLVTKRETDMHGRKGKLHVHACSYKEWTWWAHKSRYLDIRGVSSSGEVRVDHLSLVQVSFHELWLNKASSCVHVSVGACMARHGPTWSKPSLVGLQYGLPVYCAKYSLRWRSEFMILVLNKSTLFRKRIWKRHKHDMYGLYQEWRL